MEKRKAHYSLDMAKTLILSGNFYLTKIAENNAINDFSFSKKEVIEIIKELTPDDLYKSMTSNLNNKIWQDVYHKPINKAQTAYIKLQIVKNNTVIIQFKEK